MIEKIKRLFHVDKWWGKLLFIVVTYLVFWFVFYGLWIFGIIPDFLDSRINDWIPFIYFFILIPLASFFLAFFCKKITRTKFIYLLIFNVLFIIVSLSIFVYSIISSFGISF